MKLTPYQKAVKEVAGIIIDAIKDDGHDKESAIDQAITGFEEDVCLYLAQKDGLDKTKTS